LLGVRVWDEGGRGEKKKHHALPSLLGCGDASRPKGTTPKVKLSSQKSERTAQAVLPLLQACCTDTLRGPHQPCVIPAVCACAGQNCTARLSVWLRAALGDCVTSYDVRHHVLAQAGVATEEAQRSCELPLGESPQIRPLGIAALVIGALRAEHAADFLNLALEAIEVVQEE
jgi:hypothetical protein